MNFAHSKPCYPVEHVDTYATEELADQGRAIGRDIERLSRPRRAPVSNEAGRAL